MQKLIDEIYTGAITDVFTNESLRSPFFGCLCYKHCIEEGYRLTILGNEIETEYDEGEITVKGRTYTIHISYETYTEKGLEGVEILSVYETYDNTHESLYRYIGKVIEKCFGKKKIHRAA